MELNPSEKQSALWMKLREHCTERIEELHRKNEGKADEVDTAHIRGRIAAFRAILDMEKDNPVIKS